MTSYFWSGFPSLSGRSDVMYGRRHIGGATHPPATVTPIGSDSCAIVPPITVVPRYLVSRALLLVVVVHTATCRYNEQTDFSGSLELRRRANE